MIAAAPELPPDTSQQPYSVFPRPQITPPLPHVLSTLPSVSSSIGNPTVEYSSAHGIGRVIPGYTFCVKTAISLPDETFDRVAQRASDLGVSRSEFFARAAQRYLDELDAESLTGQIDNALDRVHGTDEAEAAAVVIGRRVLDAVDDEW